MFGVFFVIQSYGYSVGFESEPKLNISIIAAIALGAKHMSNIVLPFSGIAWPLGPTICGILLLYTVFLPEQIRAAREDSRVRVAITWFAAALIILSITIIAGATAVRVDGIAKWWRGIIFINFLEPIGYALLWVILWKYFFRKFASRISDQIVRCWEARPWPEMAMAVCVAWLLMLAFLSSEFDGKLDRIGYVLTG